MGDRRKGGQGGGGAWGHFYSWNMLDAEEWAGLQVEAVRDDTRGRVELLERTYRGSGRRLPYRRAALSFMRWQVGRGLLEPLAAPSPGSPWWRAVNERLLRDGCEGIALASGRPVERPGTGVGARRAVAAGEPSPRPFAAGGPSSPAVELWVEFGRRPSARRWYRAHNASIVSAYLEHRSLAERETEAERFFVNVALLRVLYAHALVAAPSLALGNFAPFGRLLGDPRLGMAGAFLSLGRVLPNSYPLNGELHQYLRQEHGLGRTLDYSVIAPRLQRLYEWSADQLRLPGLLGLIRDGLPAYVWPADRSDAWLSPRPSPLGRLLGAAISPPTRAATRS